MTACDAAPKPSETPRELVERARREWTIDIGVTPERATLRMSPEEFRALLDLASLGASLEGATEAWRVDLTCCGRSDGAIYADIWENADAQREAYCNAKGHERSGIIRRVLILPPSGANPE